MAKIKNWSRVKSQENRLDHVVRQWENDALPVVRTVRVEKFPNKPYVVKYSENRNPIKKTNDKDEAIKAATKWLKNNPAPDVPQSVREEAM